jgi:hypothetical protein
MPTKRDDVIAAIEIAFPGRDLPGLLAVVDRYGSEPHEPEAERVRLAIVELSQGDEQRLQSLVQAAKVDYRDVLAWKELGPISLAQGERLQHGARALIDSWGKR